MFNSTTDAEAISHVWSSNIRLNNPAAHGSYLLLPMQQYSTAEVDMDPVGVYLPFSQIHLVTIGTNIVGICVLEGFLPFM